MSNQPKNKTMKKFPRIVDYIQAEHPDLGGIIDDLALQNSFVPRRAGGITFLVPNAKYTADIRARADGDEPEIATDMIQSLILPVLLEEVSDWKDYSDDVPNLLGKRVDVASVGVDKIILRNGSIITRNKVFKPFTRSGASERANMAVWDLNGFIDLEAPVSARKSGALKRKPIKTRDSQQDDATIRRFVKIVESREKVAMKTRGDHVRSTKLNVLCNVWLYLQDHAAELEFKEMIDYFREICDLTACGGIEAAFYLLWCCRDAAGVDNVRRVGLFDSVSLAKIIQDSTVDLFTNCDKPLALLATVSTASGDADLTENITNMTQSVRARSIDDVVKLYDSRVAEMTGYCGARYKSAPGLKLLVDEFKHCTVLNWLTWRESYDSRSSAYNEFLNTLGRYGLPDTIINNPESQSIIMGMHRLYKLNPKDITRDHTAYLTDFLGDDGSFRNERDHTDLPDTLRYRSPDQEYNNDEMALSSATKTEVRNFMAKHGGKLPDNLF